MNPQEATQMRGRLQEHLQNVREVARRIVEENYPEEAALFGGVWEVFETRAREWQELPPEKWLLGEGEQATAEGLGFAQEGAVDIVAFRLMAATNEVFVRVMERAGGPVLGRVSREVEDCGKKFNVPTVLWAKLSDLVSAAVVVALRQRGQRSARAAQEESASGTAGPLITAARPAALTMAVGLADGRPSVLLGGREDCTFRTAERLFGVLARLVAARKRGSGWLHKKEELHELLEGSQAYYELKRHLEAISGLREIVTREGGEEGKVRLDLPKEAVSIGKSICDFRSRHLGWVRNFVAETPQKEERREEFYKRGQDSLRVEALNVARNSLLVAEAARDMGWRLRDRECLRVLEAVLARLPEGWGQHADFQEIAGMFEGLRAALA